jgi:hypothetical protein
MKAFWAIVVVLVLVAAGLMFLRGRGGSPSPALAPAPSPAAATPAMTPAPEPPRAAAPTPTPPATEQPAATTAAAAAPADTTVRPVPAPVAPSGVSPKPVDPARAGASTPATAPATAPAPAPAPTKPLSPEDELALNAMAVEMIRDFDSALGLRNPTGLPVAVTPPPPGAAAAASASPPPLDPNAKAKLTPRDDGTVLVDDRFVIKGKGDKANPYVVTWEMLVSAQETYQPRLGRKVIPDRLKMLDGKWVRIAGFIAFPIMAQTQDEMLMMLNQWDGCCIGVPPTPYDAIEVKLAEAAKGEDRLRVSGTVTGILRVDPYLVKDWLVSLYLMDDAILTIEANAAKREPTMIEGHQAQ